MRKLKIQASANSIGTVKRMRPAQSVPSAQMKPGYGVVESVTPVRRMPERSAAAGGSAAASGARGKPMYRVGVRLPDGSVQFRDLDKPEFRIGDNVLLTNAGDIVPD